MRLNLEHHHLFTHAGCMDGSGAAILFRHAGGDPKNVHWIKAGHVEEALDEPVFKDSRVPILFVDIAPGTGNGAAALSQRGNFQVIDHHASAEFLAGCPGFLISQGNTACGTEMFRRWLFANGVEELGRAPYRRFAAVIDDHDRWIMQQPMSIEIPRLFALIGQKEFVERFMDVEGRFAQERDRYWTPAEAEMLELIGKAQADRFKHLCENKFVRRTARLGDREISAAYIVSDEVNCSELLNQYLDLHPEVDMAVQINVGSGKVSLRSKGKADCMEFAQSVKGIPGKGGGHAGAAGHSLPEGLIDLIIRSVHG